MTEQLVVRLGSQPNEPIHWVVLASEEVIASGVLAGHHELGQLTERAANRPVTALLPASETSIRLVQMPDKVNRQTINALPFMLEEDVASNIDGLHLTPLSKPKAGAGLPVLVVEHTCIETCLDAFAAAGLKVNKMVPDALLLPEFDNGFTALALDQQLLLRQGEKAWCIDADWLLPALAQIEGEEEVRVRALTELPALPERYSIEDELVELPIAYLADSALHSELNLLHGEFKLAKEGPDWLNIWKWPLALAASVLMIALVHKGVRVYELEQANKALQAQVIQEYKKIVPGKRFVRLRFRNEVKKVLQSQGAGAADSPALDMMAKIAPLMVKNGATPVSIRFDANRGEIRLQASAKSYQAFEQLSQGLQVFYQVDQGALSQEDKVVMGTLSIKAAS